jgi:hypothetical protein
MADDDFAVRATPAAATVIGAPRGKARKSYEDFENELRKQGCKVAGYRLLAGKRAGYSEYCCKALVENWRVITTFEPGVAIVVDGRSFALANPASWDELLRRTSSRRRIPAAFGRPKKCSAVVCVKPIV